MADILLDKSNFPHVPSGLIDQIHSYCTSPKDAFNLARICKALQVICKSRQIWLSSLQNLDVAQAPGITPSDQLDSLLTEVIILKVVRAVRLAHNMKAHGPLRYVQTDINPHILQNKKKDLFLVLSDCTDPQLLPGGHHSLFIKDGRLELWALKPAASEPVWVAEGPNSCSTFDFELVQGGKALTVAAAYETQIGWLIRVYKFDFKSQKGGIIMERTIQDTFSAPQLMVRANFVMVSFQTLGQIFLLNWKIHGGIILEYLKPGAEAALLGDHHIVIAANFGTENLKLASISLSSLDEHWSQKSNPKEWKRNNYSSRIAQADKVEDQGVACLCLENIKDGQPMLFAMHAFTPAWRKNTDPNVPVPGEIFVVADRELSDESYQLQSYRIQLSARRVVAPDVTWHLSLVKQGCSVTQLPVRDMDISISHTGHVFALQNGTVLCYQLFCSDAQPANELSIQADGSNTGLRPTRMTVEPVSGALVIRTLDTLRVAQPARE
ncbi:hypothetical protein DFH11DRAFT_1861994 [Phellopilus nigrolimitatus]|nr:hypothetical protein DFH11DRAFT_1861994 [Phellopilus nigrolimitatus]